MVRAFRWTVLCLAIAAGSAFGQAKEEPFTPVSGQAGKDVVWVPSPQITVDRMMEVAKVTPQDFVMDLGSGDGRNIIAAAKRGAQALGVEFNPKMVEYAREQARAAGVGDRARFVEGDMFAADVSKATVLALFLLPDNLRKLEQNFLTMLKPGTRIVVNTFGISGWEADQTETVGGDCTVWCTVMLYYVPANVHGRWRMPQGELTFEQQVQTLTGNLAGTPIKGRVRGDQVMFTVGNVEYAGRVNGDTIEGLPAGGQGAWKAVRSK